MKKYLLPSVLLLIAGIYIVLAFLMLRYDSIWINDEGNRIIATEAYALDSSPFLPDPGEGINGESPISSYPPPYFVRTADGHIRSAYSPFFPYLASFFYAFSGLTGAKFFLSFLPMLICAVVIGFIMKELQFKPRECIITASAVPVAAVPILFYSCLLLEISLFTMLSAIIFYLFIRFSRTNKEYELAIAGLLTGAALLLREETYVFFIAAVISLFICRIHVRKIVFYIIPFFAAAIPLWIWNYQDSGNIFGLHYVIYNSLGNSDLSILERIRTAFFFIFKSYGSPIPAFIISSIFILAAFMVFLPEKFQYRKQVQDVFLHVAVLAAAGNLIFMFLQPDPVVTGTLSVQSLCAAAPFVIVPLIYLRQLFFTTKPIRFLCCCCFLAVAGIGFVLNDKTAGVFFGPRHFLFIIPVILGVVFYVLYRFEISKTDKLLITALIFSSVIVQGYSLKVLNDKKHFSQQVIEAIKENEALAVGTDIFWIPEELASIHRQSDVFFLQDQEELDLFRQITGQHDEIILISQTDLPRQFSDFPSIIEKYNIKVRSLALRKNSMMAVHIFVLTKK